MVTTTTRAITLSSLIDPTFPALTMETTVGSGKTNNQNY